MAPDEIIAALAQIVGSAHVLTGKDVSARFDGYPAVRPLLATCIVRPADTEQIAATLRWCDGRGIKVVPHGGCTGLVGGGRAEPGNVVLSLERMTRVDAVDVAGATITVEAGAPLQVVQEAAAEAGFLYPVDLGARGSATIGGTISTNAGGNSVLRYGMTREQVLGLEVVLADGTILSSLNRLIKNNAGFDLKHLFIGSEGTLGVVARAVLRLRPSAEQRATAFVGVDRFDNVLALLRLVSARTGGALTSFEVMWSDFVGIVAADRRHVVPVAGEHNYYVLIEAQSPWAADMLEGTAADAWALGLVGDATLAQNLSQADAFCAIRDDIDTLIAFLAPAFLYDISLPQAEMNDYVEAIRAKLTRRWPMSRLAVFGHIADGNLHLSITTGNAADHLEVDALVYGHLANLGGSISAEHGIGLEKRPYLPISRTANEVAMMKLMKDTLDPRHTLNVGKVI